MLCIQFTTGDVMCPLRQELAYKCCAGTMSSTGTWNLRFLFLILFLLSNWDGSPTFFLVTVIIHPSNVAEYPTVFSEQRCSPQDIWFWPCKVLSSILDTCWIKKIRPTTVVFWPAGFFVLGSMQTQLVALVCTWPQKWCCFKSTMTRYDRMSDICAHTDMRNLNL